MNIHRESVVDGNETVILGLIWAIIQHYQASYCDYILHFLVLFFLVENFQ